MFDSWVVGTAERLPLLHVGNVVITTNPPLGAETIAQPINDIVQPQCLC